MNLVQINESGFLITKNIITLIVINIAPSIYNNEVETCIHNVALLYW
jgi:hypothetical protein